MMSLSTIRSTVTMAQRPSGETAKAPRRTGRIPSRRQLQRPRTSRRWRSRRGGSPEDPDGSIQQRGFHRAAECQRPSPRCRGPAPPRGLRALQGQTADAGLLALGVVEVSAVRDSAASIPPCRVIWVARASASSAVGSRLPELAVPAPAGGREVDRSDRRATNAGGRRTSARTSAGGAIRLPA